jgi:hypothetical protein
MCTLFSLLSLHTGTGNVLYKTCGKCVSNCWRLVTRVLCHVRTPCDLLQDDLRRNLDEVLVILRPCRTNSTLISNYFLPITDTRITRIYATEADYKERHHGHGQDGMNTERSNCIILERIVVHRNTTWVLSQKGSGSFKPSGRYLASGWHRFRKDATILRVLLTNGFDVCNSCSVMTPARVHTLSYGTSLFMERCNHTAIAIRVCSSLSCMHAPSLQAVVYGANLNALILRVREIGEFELPCFSCRKGRTVTDFHGND